MQTKTAAKSKKFRKPQVPAFIVLLLASIAFLVIIILNANEKDKVCFEKTCFRVEKATTEQQRETGLMNRKSLRENSGMLFIFEEEGNYAFWMKDTLIPLDMIWINSTENVVFVKKNAMPCGAVCPPIYPDKNATYVLEINSGLAQKYSIDVGDSAKIY